MLNVFPCVALKCINLLILSDRRNKQQIVITFSVFFLEAATAKSMLFPKMKVMGHKSKMTGWPCGVAD